MTPEENEQLAGIRSNAEMAVSEFAQLSQRPDFGYDEKSVIWVDGFIERQRVQDRLSSDATNGLISVLGSYLGECVIKTYGGRWAFRDNQWAVEFDSKNAAFPFNKVTKRFLSPDESIHRFFTSIPTLLERFAAPPPATSPTPISPTPPPPAKADTSSSGLLKSLHAWFSKK